MEDLHKIWGHRWLTPKAETFKSLIHRTGIRATQHIKKGEIIQIIAGVVVPKKEIATYRENLDHIGIQIEDDFFLVPTIREEIEKFGACNHSCNPNTGFANQITVTAIKDISPSEELTWDYAFTESFFESFACNCKSANCRKIIRPDDWKIPELQKKYGEYFSPYLKAKFKS